MEFQALILAAGAGTRMKSSKPKVAHEVLGKPLVRWVVDAAHQAGCSQAHVVIGTGKEVVEPLLPDCTISYQLEMLGTGHTVMCAADKLQGLSGPLVVLCGDSPLIRPETIRALVERHDAAGNVATVLTMQQDDPQGYGRIVRGDSGNVERIVEEKDCTPEQRAITECNTGIYCFNAPELLGNLDQLNRDNAQGEYYLTDMLAILSAEGHKVDSVVVEDPDECRGVNSRSQLAQVAKIAQRRRNNELMDAGVTLFDPELVWVGPDAHVENDVELLPMTMLMGATTVASGSIIGPNTRLTDCAVGHGCTVEETVGIEAVLEDDVSCGPRAYLRQGTHMCTGSKAGTHVEIKKSTIGPDSKVPHLSYIGDATLGRNVNIGAGTITCNYDGVHKSKTVVGDDCLIGSDTMLVAPVTLGSHVCTGAGSAITGDVPDGALALERTKQVNVEGYWDKHKQGL